MKKNENQPIEEFFDEELLFRPLYREKQEPEKDVHQILVSYKILIEEIICWSARKDYTILIDRFLKGEMNGSKFRDEFLTLWFSDFRKMREMKQKIEERQRQQIGDLSSGASFSISCFNC